MSWQIVFTKRALADAGTAAASKQRAAILELLAMLQNDPSRTAPPYMALQGDLRGANSRRINFRDRIIYQVHEEEQIVKVIRICTFCIQL